MATEESLEPGADKKFLGSTFIVKADSLEEVRKRMEADVYWTENVVRELAYYQYLSVLSLLIGIIPRRRSTSVG